MAVCQNRGKLPDRSNHQPIGLSAFREIGKREAARRLHLFNGVFYLATMLVLVVHSVTQVLTPSLSPRHIRRKRVPSHRASAASKAIATSLTCAASCKSAVYTIAETTASYSLCAPKVTAKIDFSMMVLLDIIKKGLQGSEFRCRQVLPTSSHRSCSVGDVPDVKVRTVQHPRDSTTCALEP